VALQRKTTVFIGFFDQNRSKKVEKRQVALQRKTTVFIGFFDQNRSKKVVSP